MRYSRSSIRVSSCNTVVAGSMNISRVTRMYSRAPSGLERTKTIRGPDGPLHSQCALGCRLQKTRERAHSVVAKIKRGARFAERIVEPCHRIGIEGLALERACQRFVA